MSVATIFNIQLIVGYVPWLLFFGTYIWPRFQMMDRIDVERAIATLHSFRFFGLIFLVPGVVGANLPADFATFAAYGDFATGLLAMLALLTTRMRALFWFFVGAFNVVGTVDIIVDYYQGNQLHLADFAGQLSGAYAIVMIYVPLLMITHIVAFYLLMRSQSNVTRAVVRDVVAA
jgi:hypothetical protein